jgi:hypothetical protein
VTNGFPVNRFDGGVGASSSRSASDDHDGDLLDERSEFLSVESFAEGASRCREGGRRDESFESGLDRLFVRFAKEVVAFAVVGEMSRFEHEGETKLLNGGEDRGNEGLVRVFGRDGS